MEKDDIKNIYIAVIVSIGVIFATNYFYFDKQAKTQAPIPTIESAKQEQIAPSDSTKSSSESEVFISLKDALSQYPNVAIKNNAISGSIQTKGLRINNIFLSKYKQSLEANSPDVELFSPAKTKNPYYAEFGWGASNPRLKMPNADSLWKVTGDKLTPTSPITLEWNNDEGLKFVTKISLDNDYMFTINQSVENNTQDQISLYPYGLITRTQEQENSVSVVHEGLIGVLDNELKELSYEDIEEDAEAFETEGGWLGFSDRYWFSAIILNSNSLSNTKFSANNKVFQTDFVGAPVNIVSGGIGNTSNMLFVGAKEIKLLDEYTKKYNIPKFDLAVDFGWYYFLTKPFFYILDFLYNFIGNMGWAILLFAALLRLVMFPVANKSFENMAKMKKIQPKLKDLQERFADDKLKLQQETMALYSKEKVNPAAGCLPILIQIPVFFSLYKVLNIAIEIRQAPFVGWIKDLSAPDPMTISAMTGLPVPSFLDIGIWPIIMGVTMYIQQKLNPAPTNKDQARMFAMLPLIFTFMMGHFAAGLVIYWTLSNVLSLIQQKIIAKKNGV